MKYATDHAGNSIEAGANAPKLAFCPLCKAVVILRTRIRETPRGEITYFWRHENHTNPRCPARFRHDLVY